MDEEQEEIEQKSNDDHENQLEDENRSEFHDDSLDENESEVELSEFVEGDDNELEIIEDEVLDDEEIADQMTIKMDANKDIRTIQKNLIEGALYAAGSPLDIEEIATKLEISKKLVEDLITELAYEYLERSSALVIAQVGERYQMQLRPEYTESVSKFAKGGAIAEKYLRTLTIIALKQPILKSTVIKIRGTGAYEHVKYLLDNELITAEKKGRSHELMTTDKYADMFGLPKNREELKSTMISQLGLDEKKD